jgi:hypothetical protein
VAGCWTLARLTRLIVRVDLDADVQQLEQLDGELEPAGLAPAHHVEDECEDRQDGGRSCQPHANVDLVGREVHVGACAPTHPQRAETCSSSTYGNARVPGRHHDNSPMRPSAGTARVRREAQMHPYIDVLAMPCCLLALAVIVAVIRADRSDLLDMVRAIMRRKDDGDGPPSLPKP